MQSVLQVDGHLFPGNFQDRNVPITVALYGILRMREAQRMLSETFLSVKEIRAKLGNIDRSHFNREFKNFCGLTPTEFRRRLNLSQP